MLSIVTVTYKPDIKIFNECIKSILRYNDIGDDLQIVVVDNSPEKDSIIPLFEDKFSNVVFVPNYQNNGFGRGNNIGAEYFDSEYILFMNNDTELIEPIFLKLIDYLRYNVNVGFLGISQKGGQSSFFKRKESSLSYLKMKYCMKRELYNDTDFYISGAFMFFRRQIFDMCGRFDENIFMYNEEPDITNRVQKMGYTVSFIPNIYFLHKTGDRSVFSEFAYTKDAESTVYYIEKYNLHYKANRIFFNIIIIMRIKQLLALLKLKIIDVKLLQSGINCYKKKFREKMDKYM